MEKMFYQQNGVTIKDLGGIHLKERTFCIKK